MLKLRSEYSSVQGELRRHREEAQLEKNLARRAAEDAAHGWAVLLLLLLLVLLLVRARRPTTTS